MKSDLDGQNKFFGLCGPDWIWSLMQITWDRQRECFSSSYWH